MGQLIFHPYDLKLLEYGLEAGFSNPSDRNDLYLYIARQQGILVTQINDEFMLNYFKDLKIQDFSNKCEEAILNGFVSPTTGHSYRTNRDDQLNLLGEYVFTHADETITEVYWKAEDLGTQVSHTRDEFLVMVKEAFKHKKDTLLKLNTLRAQVNACTSDAEILALSW